MRLATVIGTRPEYIQSAPLSRQLRVEGHEEILVNTGQHYDDNMSKVFFRDLALQTPSYNLEVGSGTHAQQVGRALVEVESLIESIQPELVVVYGDTNATITGALAASKLGFTIAHVEAGLRSFDRRMPEEVNRIVTDHLSDLLFAPTDFAVTNLMREGIEEGVHNVGDVRVDILDSVLEPARSRQRALLRVAGIMEGEPFGLATLHRASNTDDGPTLTSLMSTLGASPLPLILPAHPRLVKMASVFNLDFPENVHVIEPVGFIDLIGLLDASRLVVTDSGGIQKEAYLLRTPTVTLRDSTEWVETVESGWNRLCGNDVDEFRMSVAAALSDEPPTHPEFYGTPGVAERILEVLV